MYFIFVAINFVIDLQMTNYRKRIYSIGDLLLPGTEFPSSSSSIGATTVGGFWPATELPS